MSTARPRGPSGPSGPKDDNRGDARAPVVLRVEYKRINSFIADYTKNISRGGTFIRTERPHALEHEFIFMFVIPTLSVLPPKTRASEELPPPSNATTGLRRLAMRGRVKWSKSEPKEEAGMGIEFVFADEAEKEAVRSFVEMLTTEALGPVLSERILNNKRK
jgi:type IV pilus assembly protein PilZ